MAPQYRLTMPTYYAHGLLFGTLHTEIGDSTVIVCEKSGLRTEITFHQKPMFRGEYHRVTGTVIDMKTKAKLYTFTGKWNEDFKLKNLQTKVRGGTSAQHFLRLVLLSPWHLTRRSPTPTRRRRRRGLILAR